MIALELRGPTGEKAAWTQQVEVEGFDAKARRERDHEAIIDYLGHERAMLLFHATIAGKPGDSELTWDGRQRPFGRATHKRPGIFGLTLESMLTSWARDPETLTGDVREAITARIEILRRSLEERPPSDEKRAEDLKNLNRFGETWKVLLAAAGREGR